MDTRIKSSLNLLYSLLMILFFLGGTYLDIYVSENMDFRWGRLYLIVSALIFAIAVLKRIKKRKFPNLIKDKYIVFMILIFIWGMFSSIFSIQTILSIKKTILGFWVFLIFYIIPRYFYEHNEKSRFFTLLLYPLNILATVISTINLVYFFKLIELNKYIPFWTVRSSAYKNPNTFGVRIMLTLMAMNIYLLIDEKFRDKLDKNIKFKIYILFSYLVLIINLIISGARSSVLGTIIAFIPIMYRYKKGMISALIPVSWVIWDKREEFFLFKKLSKGTSGRTEFWQYAIEEIIPKHPVLGVGSGAFEDYVGNIFNVKHMHNSYLDEIMSNGFVGFTLWMIILILIFQEVFMLEKHRSVFMFTIFGFMAHSFFEIGLFGSLDIKMSIFWIVIVLVEKQLSMQNLSYGGENGK